MPNISDTSTVTVTSASSTTATPSTNLTTCPTPSTSSNNATAVGAGVGVPLGLALLGALGLLWSQRSRAKRGTRIWEEKYDELKKEQQRGGSGGRVEVPIQELGASVISVERPTQELGGWRPDEVDGRLAL